MKIKTTKQMRLDELIRYIYENGIVDEIYKSDSLGFEVLVNLASAVKIDAKSEIGICVHKEILFTVQVEEEVTEKTVFDKLLFTYKNPSGCIRTACYEDSSMDDINKKFDVVGLRSVLIVHDNGLTTEIWNAVDGFLDDVVKDKDNA